MCTSASADQRSEALGARNAGECRLAQDGLEHDEAGAAIDERQEEQGDEEESGERAADHFEETGPLVVERVRPSRPLTACQVALPKARFLPSPGLR